MRFGAVPVCAACLHSPAPLLEDHSCDLCGLPFEEAAALQGTKRCGACLAEPPVFDRARGFGVHEGELRRLIHLLKYDRMRPLAKPLAGMMATVLASLPVPDLVVPVPLYRARRWRRGFNQALALSEELGRQAGIRCEARVLRRIRATQPQAGLSYAERKRNVANAFVVRQRDRVAGKTVLVIDDVMTTGATLDACARALKKAGARSVLALTAARAKRRILPVHVGRVQQAKPRAAT
ncbi:MAG: ComF family protein [Acidobacteria bacterium]|nr:ComF family protein [Acidobacteriota bacterium]